VSLLQAITIAGGVIAALEDRRHGLIDNWLRNILDVAREYQTKTDALPAGKARFDRLCELIVLAQRQHVCERTLVQDAWVRGQELQVHGWIYSLEDGHIRELKPPVTKLSGLML